MLVIFHRNLMARPCLMRACIFKHVYFVYTEAATEKVFQNICSFFPGATFLQFSRSVYLFVEQTCFFPGESICSSNRHVFPGGSILFSSNRHEFLRRVYRTNMSFQEKKTILCSSNRPY